MRGMPHLSPLVSGHRFPGVVQPIHIRQRLLPRSIQAVQRQFLIFQQNFNFFCCFFFTDSPNAIAAVAACSMAPPSFRFPIQALSGYPGSLPATPTFFPVGISPDFSPMSAALPRASPSILGGRTGAFTFDQDEITAYFK